MRLVHVSIIVVDKGPQKQPVVERPPQEPFDATSSYRADYPAHDVKPREFAPKVGGGVIEGSAFDATSSYRADFPAHAVKPREFAPKVGGGVIEAAPFDADTEYRQEFAAPIAKCA